MIVALKLFTRPERVSNEFDRRAIAREDAHLHHVKAACAIPRLLCQPSLRRGQNPRPLPNMNRFRWARRAPVHGLHLDKHDGLCVGGYEVDLTLPAAIPLAEDGPAEPAKVSSGNSLSDNAC